jgi:hypothetical protein
MFKHAFLFVFALFTAAGIAFGSRPATPADQHSAIGNLAREGDKESGPASLPQTPATTAPRPYEEEDSP